MDIGHIGAGLAFKKADKKINVGLLIFAAMFLDVVFAVCVLIGVETVPTRHEGWQYLFSTLPYSHGILASLIWSALAFGFVYGLWRKWGWRTALIFAAAVFSHFICDLIYFAPGVSRDLITAIELVLIIAGMWLYLGTKRKRTFFKMIVFTLLGVILVMLINSLPALVAGWMLGAQSPGPAVVGTLGIIQPVVLSGLAYWLDRSKILEKG